MSEQAKRAVKLPAGRLGEAQYERQDFVGTAEEGTVLADVLEPSFWTHHASRLKPFDRVEVREESGNWIAEVVVLQVDRNWAKVHLLAMHDLMAAQEDAPAPQRFAVQWKGPQKKHVVMRLADGVILQEGFSSKTDAMSWAVNHEQVIEAN